jgi:hypothetical protein
MKQYKINRDKKEQAIPSDEVIEKYRNFKRLNVSYNEFTKRSKVPLYRNKKMFLFLMLIGLVAWLVAEGVFDEKEKSEEKTEIKK